MKTLHFPFHGHRWHRGHLAERFHHLVHDDRFWAVLTLVLFLVLFIAMGVLAMRTNTEGTYSPPYFY
jgi:hypothetical protein